MANIWQKTLEIANKGAGIAAGIDISGAVTAFSNAVNDNINAVVDKTQVTQTHVDRSLANNSNDMMDTLLGVSVSGYCDFNTLMGAFMERLMKINVGERNKTLNNVGAGAYLYGDSSTISNEVKNYSYVKDNNYLETFAKHEIADKDGRANSTVSKTPFSKTSPYEERTSLYPDDLSIGHSNFKPTEKWKVNNKNSILYKTKKLFEQGKINTIISRFGTNADGSSHGVNYTGSIRTKYGESRGRNLLKADAEKNLFNKSYAINGYNNPYCRVWTHHHQYNRLSRAIRPFLNESQSWGGSIINGDAVSPAEFHDWANFKEYSPNKLYNRYKGGNEGREYSVLDVSKGGDGLVKITPKFNGGEAKNIHAKDCMFSIENLAWRGYDPYAFEDALSWEQRGPLGGRIMWFPPYGIQFSEATNVKWNSNTFIGRGEDVYTYINTSRTGTLSFLMVVDHPSIINYAMWSDNLDESDETDLLRFFAGCDSLSPDDPNSIMSKIQPTPLTDEWIKNEVNKSPVALLENVAVASDNNIHYEEEPGNKILLDKYVVLFYPNNFSGVDAGDNEARITEVLYYLFAGKGRGSMAKWIDNSAPKYPLPEGTNLGNLFERIKTFTESEDDASVRNNPGFQMGRTSRTFGISADDDKSAKGIYVWVDSGKVNELPHRIGKGKSKEALKSAAGDWVSFGVNRKLSNKTNIALKLDEGEIKSASEMMTLYEVLRMWAGNEQNIYANTEKVEIFPLIGFESAYSTKNGAPLPTSRLNTLKNCLSKIFKIKLDSVEKKQDVIQTEQPPEDKYKWMYENKIIDNVTLNSCPHNDIRAILNRSAVCRIKLWSQSKTVYTLSNASSQAIQQNAIEGYEVKINDFVDILYKSVKLPSSDDGGTDMCVHWILKPKNEILAALMQTWPLNEYTEDGNKIIFSGTEDSFVLVTEGGNTFIVKSIVLESGNSCVINCEKTETTKKNSNRIECSNNIGIEPFFRENSDEVILNIYPPVPFSIGVANALFDNFDDATDGNAHTISSGGTQYTYKLDRVTGSYYINFYGGYSLLCTAGDGAFTKYENTLTLPKVSGNDISEKLLMYNEHYNYNIKTEGGNIIITRVQKSSSNLPQPQQGSNIHTNDNGNGGVFSYEDFLGSFLEKKQLDSKEIILPTYCQVFDDCSTLEDIKNESLRKWSHKWIDICSNFGGKFATVSIDIGNNTNTRIINKTDEANSEIKLKHGSFEFSIEQILFTIYEVNGNPCFRLMFRVNKDIQESNFQTLNGIWGGMTYTSEGTIKNKYIRFDINCQNILLPKKAAGETYIGYFTNGGEEYLWCAIDPKKESEDKDDKILVKNGRVINKNTNTEQLKYGNYVIITKDDIVSVAVNKEDTQQDVSDKNDERISDNKNKGTTVSTNEDKTTTAATNGNKTNCNPVNGPKVTPTPAQKTTPPPDNGSNAVSTNKDKPKPKNSNQDENVEDWIEIQFKENGKRVEKITITDGDDSNCEYFNGFNKVTFSITEKTASAMMEAFRDFDRDQDQNNFDKYFLGEWGNNKKKKIFELGIVLKRKTKKKGKKEETKSIKAKITYRFEQNGGLIIAHQTTGGFGLGCNCFITLDSDTNPTFFKETQNSNENYIVKNAANNQLTIRLKIYFSEIGDGETSYDAQSAQVVLNNVPVYGTSPKKEPEPTEIKDIVINEDNKCELCDEINGRVQRNNERNIYRYDQEYYFFKSLRMTDRLAYNSLIEKIRYFDPAFHSMTPEGFNARLTFLNQCTRQGMTKSASDAYGQTANNMAFGRPPFCVLRIGDFYNQMIVIDNINIDYSVSDGIQWDMNTEGIGMQPLLARVDINFKFIGGGDIQGPIRRLQNAMTFNYYANTRFYDNRADRVRYGNHTYDYKAMGAIDYNVNNEDSSSYVTRMRKE